MLVSVIIPAFNVAGCLDRAIDSVLAQTLQDFEIIVVDDASSDGTVDLVRQRAALDHRISLLQNPVNSGPSVARNRGIGAARGEWIAILDADDAYEPDRLEALCGIGETNRAHLVADNLVLYDAVAEVRTGLAISGLSDNAVDLVSTENFLRNGITGRSPFDYGQLKAMMRRNFLLEQDLRYPETLRHGEDFDLYARVLLAGGRFVLVGKPRYLFTQRVGQVSGKSSGFSRSTIANFDAMRRFTLSLLAHPAVQGNVQREALIHERASAILWHKSHMTFSNFARDRDLTGLLRASLTDWRIVVVLMRRIGHRLLRAATPPGLQNQA